MPVSVRRELQAQLVPYRRHHPHVRWTRPESWHLTLLFLGSVEVTAVGQLERGVRSTAQRTAAYDVRVQRGGGRTRHKEGVAWLGLSRGAGTLIETARRMAAACPPDVTTGPPPKRTPSAHLTVVRKADEAVIEALQTQAHGPLGVGWTVDRIELVRSHLEPGGARYETLYEAAL